MTKKEKRADEVFAMTKEEQESRAKTPSDGDLRVKKHWKEPGFKGLEQAFGLFSKSCGIPLKGFKQESDMIDISDLK